MRDRYEQQLRRLNMELITMGAMCEEAISGCVKYLAEKTPALLENVLEAEKAIDRKEREIENMCMKLIMQQQPVAGDLRYISSALRMISDMERIGDQAADIADIARHIPESRAVPAHISDMAREAINMVTGSVDSFVKKDSSLAEAVISGDDIVDGLFTRVRGDLIAGLTRSADKAETAADFLMIAKYFERIGDHAVNIAEWVIYSVTGKLL